MNAKIRKKFKILPTSDYSALKTLEDKHNRSRPSSYVNEMIPCKWKVPLTVVRGDKLPRIQLKIQHVLVNNCFIDTGASRTIITHKLAKRIFGSDYKHKAKYNIEVAI